MLKARYSTLTRIYSHILPNPVGFEASKIHIRDEDRRIKSRIVQCQETYQDMANVVVPDNKPVEVFVVYRSKHVLGCDIPRVCKKYRIYRDDIMAADNHPIIAPNVSPKLFK